MPLHVRTYRFTTRNKVTIAALAIAGIAVGGVLLVLGLTLLVGVLAAGAVLGTGVALSRRLGGLRRVVEPPSAHSGLDPADEVFLPRGDAEDRRE